VSEDAARLRSPGDHGLPRVLGMMMLSNYGIPESGYGYEYYNLIPAFERLPIEFRNFDYAQEIIDHGYWAASAGLKRIIEQWKPHALFFTTYTEQVDRDLMRWITEETPTVTIGWFSDDHWRFKSYSRYWAEALNWVVTTDADAVQKYRAIGQPNVILSQWAANELVYRPSELPLEYDVSFVGRRYGPRESAVEHLRRNGVSVATFGPEWPGGGVSQDKMMEVFSRSRVNLNLAASSKRDHLRSSKPQIKGRVFEVPACGGLLLTDYAPHLEDYYDIGSEVVVYTSKRDMLRKVVDLLGDEPRRASIARAGYERTVRDHTWVGRLREILSQAGVLEPTDGEVLAHERT